MRDCCFLMTRDLVISFVFFEHCNKHTSYIHLDFLTVCIHVEKSFMITSLATPQLQGLTHSFLREQSSQVDLLPSTLKAEASSLLGGGNLLPKKGADIPTERFVQYSPQYSSFVRREPL